MTQKGTASNPGRFTDDFERRIDSLSRDFVIEQTRTGSTVKFELKGFRGFIGQDDHERHLAFATARNRIS